jgi:uncharacterized protein (TIGR02145 family)
MLLSILLNAQAPALIPYQAVARNGSGQALSNATINARFTIHDGTATGVAVWQEMQTVTTSALGLFTASLGTSVPLTGVNWGSGDKFMQVEIDLGQGFLDLGTQQMLSVPYALYGNAAGNGIAGVSTTGDTLFMANGNYLIVPGISAANDNSGGGGTTTGTTEHTCGAANVHNPNLTYGSLTDQEGNVYKTIVIGTQEWMAENLNTSVYRNGDAINNDGIYNSGDVSYSCPYGKLYSGTASLDSRHVCPLGWHVPTDGEWEQLFLEVGEDVSRLISMGTIQMGNGYWNSSTGNASNSSGFSALPGSLSYGDEVNWSGESAWFWSSTPYNQTSTSGWVMDDNYFASEPNMDNTTFLSVRCIHD